MAAIMFHTAGFAFVTPPPRRPTLPGMEIRGLSEHALLDWRFYQLNEGEACSTFVWTLKELLPLSWAMAALVWRT